MGWGKCCICTTSFALHQNVTALKCGHTFHRECVQKWLKNSKSCPNCRQRTLNSDVVNLFIDDPDESSFFQQPAENVDVDQLNASLTAANARIEQLHTIIQDLEQKQRIACTDMRTLKARCEKATEQCLSFQDLNCHLERQLEDQQSLKNQIADLQSRNKAYKFYDILMSKSGGDEAEIKKYIGPSGDPDSAKFLSLFRKQAGHYKKALEEKKAEMSKMTIELREAMLELQKYKSGMKRSATKEPSKDYSRHPRPSFGFPLDESGSVFVLESTPKAKRSSENGAGSDDVFKSHDVENIPPPSRPSILCLTEIKATGGNTFNYDGPSTSKAAAKADFYRRIDSSGSLDEAIQNQLEAFQSTPIKAKPAASSQPVERPVADIDDDDVCILSPQIPKSRFDRGNQPLLRKLIYDKTAITHNNAFKKLGEIDRRNGQK